MGGGRDYQPVNRRISFVESLVGGGWNPPKSPFNKGGLGRISSSAGLAIGSLLSKALGGAGSWRALSVHPSRSSFEAWRREWDSNPRYSRPYSGFQVRLPLPGCMPPRLIFEHPVSDPRRCLYLSSALVLPCPYKYVGNLVGNLHSSLTYGHPSTDLASFPIRSR